MALVLQLRLLPDERTFLAVGLVLGGHAQHPARAFPFMAGGINDEGGWRGLLDGRDRLAIDAGGERLPNREHVIPAGQQVAVGFPAAALRLDHHDAPVWPDEAPREHQRRPGLAATGLAIEADQRLGFRALGWTNLVAHGHGAQRSWYSRSTHAASIHGGNCAEQTATG